MLPDVWKDQLDISPQDVSELWRQPGQYRGQLRAVLRRRSVEGHGTVNVTFQQMTIFKPFDLRCLRKDVVILNAVVGFFLMLSIFLPICYMISIV